MTYAGQWTAVKIACAAVLGCFAVFFGCFWKFIPIRRASEIGAPLLAFIAFVVLIWVIFTFAFPGKARPGKGHAKALVPAFAAAAIPAFFFGVQIWAPLSDWTAVLYPSAIEYEAQPYPSTYIFACLISLYLCFAFLFAALMPYFIKLSSKSRLMIAFGIFAACLWSFLANRQIYGSSILNAMPRAMILLLFVILAAFVTCFVIAAPWRKIVRNRQELALVMVSLAAGAAVALFGGLFVHRNGETALTYTVSPNHNIASTGSRAELAHILADGVHIPEYKVDDSRWYGQYVDVDAPSSLVLSGMPGVQAAVVFKTGPAGGVVNDADLYSPEAGETAITETFPPAPPDRARTVALRLLAFSVTSLAAYALFGAAMSLKSFTNKESVLSNIAALAGCAFIANIVVGITVSRYPADAISFTLLNIILLSLCVYAGRHFKRVQAHRE